MGLTAILGPLLARWAAFFADGLSVGVGDSHSAVDFKLSKEVGALTTGSEHYDASPSPGRSDIEQATFFP
jgi:hypothetical protein